MEYGGISPLGLPAGWRVLVDRRVAEAGKRQAEIDKKDAEQRAIAQAKLDAARQQYEQQVAKIQAENGQPR